MVWLITRDGEVTEMADSFRITIAQTNPVLGDLAGNSARARAAWEEGRAARSDLVGLPELSIAGYQPQDLVTKRAFTLACMAAVDQLAADCADGPALGIGTPLIEDGKLYNSYAICQGGRVIHRIRKHELPNYAVFDEKRVFASGEIAPPYRIGALTLGTPICEDAWFPAVSASLKAAGAEVLFVPNGSPYYRNKFARRMSFMQARVAETGLPMVYLNMVGAQDDQVFDGGSFVLHPGPEVVQQLPLFDEAIRHIDLEKRPEGWRALNGEKVSFPDEWEQDYRAMVQSLRDYLGKTGFKRVLLGLSGGIDSALVATIAADSIGPENVRCVMLPSDFTSKTSLDDARDVATRLGTPYQSVPIAGAKMAVEAALGEAFKEYGIDITEENIQSRLRGVMLMAMSNKFGEMLLTTGNKSEVAVGYCTIYGDMAGGYNPLKDLYKMRVFETCRWRNRTHRPWMKGPAGEVIPKRVIDKPPSAELRPNQRDDDSLPPYEVLDVILENLVDKEASVADVVALGYDHATVKKIERLIYLSEYKRAQAAPGTRLTRMSFGMDRRYPIVNRYRDEA
jgi:NAD+ synthase